MGILKNYQTLFVFLIALLWIVVLLGGLEAQQQKTKIGVILPLTGAFARYGMRIQKTISEYSNDKVEFVFEDEGCDPKTAFTAYKKLTELNQVKYFLGPWCGSPQNAVAPQIKVRNQLVMLGSSASVAVYASSGERMFSTQHSIEDEAAFVAQQVAKTGAKKVVIVFRENQFSRAHEASFRAHFNGEILRTFAYSSDDITELQSIALQVKKLKPDVLFIPDAFPLMAGFVKELNAIRVNNTRIYSVYSAQSDDVLKVLGSGGEGLIYSYPDIKDKEALDYFPLLAAKFLTGAIETCGEDVECARKHLLSKNTFDKNGVLTDTLILKTIKNGAFVYLEN